MSSSQTTLSDYMPPHVSTPTALGLQRDAGRRVAVIIAIMYARQVDEKGDNFELNGSHKGAILFKEFLMTFGYKEENIMMLLDNGNESGPTYPTRNNIIMALKKLVEGAAPGDHFFVYYSGHGSQIINLDGREKDNLDEVILCVDWKFNPKTNKQARDRYENVILDDELNNILVKSLPPGSQLVALFDCCNAGTMMDLEFNRHCRIVYEEPEGDDEALGGILYSPKAVRRDSVPHHRSSSGGPLDLHFAVKAKNKKTSIVRGDSQDPLNVPSGRAHVVSWCSSSDGQQSWQHRDSGGVMASAFIKCLTSNPHPTYRQLLLGLTETLKEKCKIIRCETGRVHILQEPQLGFNNRPDMNTTVTL